MFMSSLKKLVSSVFMSMQYSDVNFIYELLIEIIDWISIHFDVDINLLKSSLETNNYERAISIMFLLLPYVREPEKIRTLEEIYTKKYTNNDEPLFIHSFIQYGRHKRSPFTEVKLEKDFIIHNFNLLKKTIQALGNKLFVNWGTVIPISINDASAIKKVKNTTKLLLSNAYKIESLKDKISFIHPMDVYSTIVYELFERVKNIKWLLYYKDNIQFSELARNLVSNSFQSNWNNLLKEKEPSEFLIAIIYFFNKYSNNINKAINNGYHRFTIQTDDTDYYKDTEHTKIEKSIIIDSALSVKPEFILEYINYSLELLTNTAYKDIVKTDYDFMPKNYYNFAKSLSHKTVNNKYKYFGHRWINLLLEDRQTVINRLNTPINDIDSIMAWFNISRSAQTNDPRDFHRRLFTSIKSNLAILTAQLLAFRGCLTSLNPNGTPKKNFNRQWNNCYDFNGQKYDSMKPCGIDYFTFTKEKTWYTTYSVTWVSQIAFFHRFFNNKVILVTGATGVGKSTQTPKLCLYASRAFLYTDDTVNNTVVCTQPRIPPTVGNANRISEELCLPIIDGNFTVQYRHRFESHITASMKGNVLRFMTDGSLLNTINSYKGIVIVDEAHEHNANMDLILTIMKHILLGKDNTQTRLIIISATMENDEPLYRRYFRDINDNVLYGYDEYDRINVDRRVHLAPPGQQTRHKILEKYVPGKQLSKLVTSILLTDNRGDILVFQPGEREIVECIEELNRVIPGDTLALPYFSSMPKHQKKLIESIDKPSIRRTIKYPRDCYIDILTGRTNNFNAVIKEYTRFVIVATNIAEASITISSLRYVIDTGVQKIQIFEPITGSESLKEVPISELSRVQRKGRVGRVAPGQVYYLYTKNTRQNTPYYGITLGDISTSLITLMTSSNENIFEYEISTIGNTNHYDYTPFVPHTMYIQGEKVSFSKDTLDDKDASFYLVHPEENSIKRTMDGKAKGKVPNINILTCLMKMSIISESSMTKYGNIVAQIASILSIEHRQVVVLLHGIKYGVNDILHIICVLEMVKLGRDIRQWAITSNSVKAFSSVFSNADSDLLLMVSIGKRLIKVPNTELDMTNFCNTLQINKKTAKEYLVVHERVIQEIKTSRLDKLIMNGIKYLNIHTQKSDTGVTNCLMAGYRERICVATKKGYVFIADPGLKTQIRASVVKNPKVFMYFGNRNGKVHSLHRISVSDINILIPENQKKYPEIQKIIRRLKYEPSN